MDGRSHSVRVKSGDAFHQQLSGYSSPLMTGRNVEVVKIASEAVVCFENKAGEAYHMMGITFSDRDRKLIPVDFLLKPTVP